MSKILSIGAIWMMCPMNFMKWIVMEKWWRFSIYHWRPQQLGVKKLGNMRSTCRLFKRWQIWNQKLNSIWMRLTSQEPCSVLACSTMSISASMIDSCKWCVLYAGTVSILIHEKRVDYGSIRLSWHGIACSSPFYWPCNRSTSKDRHFCGNQLSWTKLENVRVAEG